MVTCISLTTRGSSEPGHQHVVRRIAADGALAAGERDRQQAAFAGRGQPGEHAAAVPVAEMPIAMSPGAAR